MAAEPGGSVTVDKPPLGLWIQAASAYVLGVSGFSVVLPSILAGLASIVLLYHLVRKHFGPGAGLLAAVVLAVTPVALAADRNNTADSILTFFLLLASWAFIRATESGKLRYLLAGALLVGLAFNIKMLQAYLLLPALYALYFFAARAGWGRKLLNLGLATALLLVVSLAWAVAVDLRPADQRPYVGSSEDNTVMELIVGHNGLNRLFGGGGGQAGAGPDGALPRDDGGQGFTPPAGDGQGGRPQNGPANGDGPAAGDGRPGQAGGAFSFETGEAGLTRFFEAPLAKEMSWLLPFALLGLGLAVFSWRLRLPVTAPAHQAALLWGGWLLNCLVFFSLAGFFHAYYMVMLAPALAALVGIGASLLWRLVQVRRRLALGLLAGASLATIAFQTSLAGVLAVTGWWLALPWLLLALALALLLLGWMEAEVWARWATPVFALALAAMLVVPAVWSGLTVAYSSHVGLPAAYSGGQPDPRGNAGESEARDQDLLDYLQANTEGMTYMMAVASAQQGSSYVIETGRGVLYMGGFNGGDPVVDADDLAQLVAEGELRYVYAGQRLSQAGVSDWLASSCSVVAEYSQRAVATLGDGGDDGPPGGPGGGRGASMLYDCGN